ncbi:uncharacterized protein LOC110065914 [Orbicella faveolata]|uniref:uncharacterized protein LOC110065914 n=1 Tax=Orbicella faveolata TaxID=48498 RepID=UPI0009E4230E|nr:uncharacterized protein LOC110065914 [Orbicella faveolata]XP_020628758.1 uncharacterized protein LOC110065914 [Orbicella faveolata]
MESAQGNCPSEAIDTEELVRTVRTMLIHSIALNNPVGFTMALEALEELKVGLSWSFLSKSIVYGGDDWNTPLTLGAKLGRASMVTSLLRKGADPNFFSNCEDRRSSGRTALHEACKSGRLQVVDCLLTHGCDVNVSDKRGWTPIYGAICHGKTDVALKLLDNGADPRKSFSVSSSDVKNLKVTGRSFLMFSSNPYKLETVTPSLFTWNGLSFASTCHQPQLVSKLIEEYFHGDADFQSSFGRTALHEAVTLPEDLNLNDEIIVQNRQETLKILLNAGINPNIADHLGKTALHLFFDHVNLAKVVVKRYSKIVPDTIRLLHDYGADLNAADFKGRTVTHQAAAFGDVETMQILLELGVVVASLDNDRNTPAHIAAYHGNFEVLQCLLHCVPHTEFANRDGDTVLHVAIMTNGKEDELVKIVQTLQREPGADKVPTNVYGETAFDLAIKFKLEKLSRQLAGQANKTDWTPGGPRNVEVQRITDVKDNGDIHGEADTRTSDTGARILDEGRDGKIKSGHGSDSDEGGDNAGVPELLVEDDTDVNECLLKLCREYRVRSFHMEGDGKCHERCTVAKQTLDFVDEILKLIVEDDKRFYCEVLRTGSAFEGYRIGKPDEFDYMCELKSLSDGRCEILETEEPGFVRVRVKEACREEWKLFLSEEGFLDATKLKCFLAKALYAKCCAPASIHKAWNLSFNTTSYDSCVFCHPVISTSKAGIKMTLYWRGTIYKFLPIDIDITPAIHFGSWPKSAKVPPSHVLKDCAGFGYHVVPKSEGGDSLLWRLSFSIAELKILQNVSPVQGACYTALKIIKGQTALPKRSQLFSHLGYLHTYVLKMKFFEELERCHDTDLWLENKLTDRICSVLDSTANLLSQKRPSQVESYFLPGHSVIRQADKHFSKFVAASIKTSLRRVVRLLRKEDESSPENVEDDGFFTMYFDQSDSTDSESGDDSTLIFHDPSTV